MLRGILEFLRRHLSTKNPLLPYYILIFLNIIIFVVGVNVFVGLTEGLSGAPMKGFDKQVTDFVTSFRTPELNRFFQFITDLGDVYAYIVATTIVAIFFFFKLKNKKFIFQLLGILILSALANIALKKAINRARPTIEHLVVVKSLSYPSGHAMSATAFYGFLIYLVFKIKMNKWLKGFLMVLFGFLILLIGTSRIYLGVHFPSDVVGGFLAGLIWVAFCIVLFNIVSLLRERKAMVDPTVEKEEIIEE